VVTGADTGNYLVFHWIVGLRGGTERNKQLILQSLHRLPEKGGPDDGHGFLSVVPGVKLPVKKPANKNSPYYQTYYCD
jgi:hypothetical protein